MARGISAVTHLLAFGLGYSARRLAARLAHETRLAHERWQITGTSRTRDGADAIIAKGWRGLVFDGTTPSPDVSDALRDATHVLVSIPPDAMGDPALRLHAANLAASPRLAWIGYFSTVGVYGDHGGAWVDEDTPCTPTSPRATRRLAAENAWRAFGAAHGKRVVVFRLPGIYGPGRSAIDTVRAGTARRIIKPGQVFNRIHVDDITEAVRAAMRGPTPRAVYNITDDLPAPPQDVVLHTAHLIGAPEPPAVPFAQANLSPMAASFYAESKRVANRHMKADLVPHLLYPTYRDGLAAIVASP
jgi:nucleoside-diphosphate-sugar epimerase